LFAYKYLNDYLRFPCYEYVEARKRKQQRSTEIDNIFILYQYIFHILHGFCIYKVYLVLWPLRLIRDTYYFVISLIKKISESEFNSGKFFFSKYIVFT